MVACCLLRLCWFFCVDFWFDPLFSRVGPMVGYWVGGAFARFWLLVGLCVGDGFAPPHVIERVSSRVRLTGSVRSRLD
jgi:hypothetical protein